jgi:hypothetical protein
MVEEIGGARLPNYGSIFATHLACLADSWTRPTDLPSRDGPSANFVLWLWHVMGPTARRVVSRCLSFVEINQGRCENRFVVREPRPTNQGCVYDAESFTPIRPHAAAPLASFDQRVLRLHIPLPP